jgi:hypothetical protein
MEFFGSRKGDGSSNSSSNQALAETPQQHSRGWVQQQQQEHRHDEYSTKQAEKGKGSSCCTIPKEP